MLRISIHIGKPVCKLCGLLVLGLTLITVIASSIIIAVNPEFLIQSTLYIGDNLLNTTGIHEASSSTGNVKMKFDIRIDSVYFTSTKPSATIEHLPEIEIASDENGYYQDYNYLGINKPIYLLAGSVINYRTRLQIKEPHDSFNSSACIILFNNLTKFGNFYRQGRHSESQMQCFTSGNTTTVPWSFNIAEESQYYVGISINRGVTVTSNVSIDRAYYNLSETELTPKATCTNSLSCNITACSNILCDTTYVIIKTKGSTGVTLLEYDISLRQWTVRSSIVLVPLCSIALVIIVTSYIRCYKCQDTSRRADDASVATSSLFEIETAFDEDDDRIGLIPGSNQSKLYTILTINESLAGPTSRIQHERNEERDSSQPNSTF